MKWQSTNQPEGTLTAEQAAVCPWILLSLLVAASSSNAVVFIVHKMVSDALFLSRGGNVFCGKLGRTTFL